jgi:alcohol dehydrogenase (cytochrome c)
MLAIGKNVKSEKRRTLVGAPCKNTVVWSFDAQSGKFLWAKQTLYQNIIDSIDRNGDVKINQNVAMRDINGVYHVCPTSQGGRDWGPSAFNPDTGLLYIQMQNLCWKQTTIRGDREPKAEYGYNIVSVWGMQPGKTDVGRIDAVDVSTGKTKWTWETHVSNYGSVLTTGGGLVFNGGQDRGFRALDAETGKQLWQTRLPSQDFGPFTSFSVNGRQYITSTAGGGFNPLGPQMTPEADAPSGDNAIFVFALPEE